MDKRLEQAAGILNISIEDAQRYSREIPEIDGIYFWNPLRGGNSVIITRNGGKLAATSAVGFEEHLAAFKNGKRN